MADVFELVDLVARLRGPDGCPWDRAQTLQTMRAYLLEETYEVLEAIDTSPDAGPAPALEGELGDLLFNVLMLIQIAQDMGMTSRSMVVTRIVEKMVRRHPHVFPPADAPAPSVEGPSLARWESVKAKERGGGSRLDGIPRASPALVYAHRQGEKAAGTGFDWPDLNGVMAKVEEELQELKDAIAAEAPDEIEAELGDVLLSLASLGRHLRTPAEDALRGAVARFDRRFRLMEAAAAQDGGSLQGLDAPTLETMWQEAKIRLAADPDRSL
ncbi:MAG: nucleoside triphosphate pyrophosphohydrolase [Deltaproteobacteria bacterium]|nr:nucleoside triphosphate pyrophosphohydrolase [Deltaproteobacteria bacterium]